MESLRGDLFYPSLTLEYYDNVLKHIKPYDNLWVVCMDSLVGVRFVETTLLLVNGSDRFLPKGAVASGSSDSATPLTEPLLF